MTRARPRLLKDVSANNYEKFAIGQAKQIVPINADGYIVTDGILLRRGENEYTLSGVPASQHWVQWHGEQGGYDVAFRTEPSSAFRFDKCDPVLFRYQLQGPRAQALVESVFGGPPAADPSGPRLHRSRRTPEGPGLRTFHQSHPGPRQPRRAEIPRGRQPFRPQLRP